MRTRAALLMALCLGMVSLSGPTAFAASATSSAAPSASAVAATDAPAAACDTSDLQMSTPSSTEDTTVYATGTRAIDPVTLTNTSSVDCPDSGFIVLLMTNPANEPEPTLEWSLDGGGWNGTSLSWDDGVVDGNASCASPCWKAGIVTLDVPAHTTDTIDLAVIFHSGMDNQFFSGAVYYTSQAVLDDGVSGPLVAFAYIDQSGSSGGGGGSGSGGGSGGSGGGSGGSSGGSGGGSGGSGSQGAGSPTVVHSQSHSPSPSSSPKTSPSARPSSSATSTASAMDSGSAAVAATPRLAPVADAHSGGSSNMPTIITLTALAILMLAAGAGFVLVRRRGGNPPSSDA